jgi:hypothetical protein
MFPIVSVSLSPFTFYIALCAQNHSGWLKPSVASRREEKRREEEEQFNKVLQQQEKRREEKIWDTTNISLCLSLSLKLEYDERKKKDMML